MTKNYFHPLSERHHRQIVRRPPAQRRKMYPIWAITWRPGDRSASFLGQMFRPLGTALMMSQVSYPLEDQKEGIGLFGIGARIDPQSASVSYEDLKLQHHFHFVPFMGAGGPILDPGEDGCERGNGSWVRLGLDVDRIRHRVSGRNFALPSVPTLPEVFLGYGSKDAARFTVTPELRRRAAECIDVPWAADSLHGLWQRKSEIADAQEQGLSALPPDAQEVLLRQEWDAAFQSPSDPGNTTGLWLLPHTLATDVYRAVRVFEFFGGLAGAPAFNPASQLGGTTVQNTAVELAAEKHFDLSGDLTRLANTTEGSPEFHEIEQRLFELVPILRQRANVSAAVSDQDLLNAICQPELPLAIEPAIQQLAESDQVRLMRGALLPHVSEATTDDALLEAVHNPNSPLFAAGLCRVQAMYRNVRVPVQEALQFSSQDLGRERVRATFWPEATPRTSSRSPDKSPLEFAAA